MDKLIAQLKRHEGFRNRVYLCSAGKETIGYGYNLKANPLHYDVPLGAETLNDLIEHKEMPFWRGEIFKSCYRINGKDGTTEIRELNKIIYNANRRLAAINKEQVTKYEQLVG